MENEKAFLSLAAVLNQEDERVEDEGIYIALLYDSCLFKQRWDLIEKLFDFGYHRALSPDFFLSLRTCDAASNRLKNRALEIQIQLEKPSVDLLIDQGNWDSAGDVLDSLPLDCLSKDVLKEWIAKIEKKEKTEKSNKLMEKIKAVLL